MGAICGYRPGVLFWLLILWQVSQAMSCPFQLWKGLLEMREHKRWPNESGQHTLLSFKGSFKDEDRCGGLCLYSERFSGPHPPAPVVPHLTLAASQPPVSSLSSANYLPFPEKKVSLWHEVFQHKERSGCCKTGGRDCRIPRLKLCPPNLTVLYHATMQPWATGLGSTDLFT